MNACCSTPAFQPPKSSLPAGTLRTVVLIGPPNSGKSTLFNRLTGLRQKVANFPGVTVEQRLGLMAGVGRPDLTLIDLPGVYSLDPYSEDARVSIDVLRGKMAGTPRPDAVLLVLDSLHLTRQLMLAAPVLALGLPTLVLLNMSDLMEARGGHIDALKLARELGTPVAQISAMHGTGRQAAGAARAGQRRQRAQLGRAGEPQHRLSRSALGGGHTQDRRRSAAPHLGTAALSGCGGGCL
jgi:ferrous iron transport protein B